MEVTPVKGVQMRSFLTWQSTETLNEFRHQPLGLLQAIGVGNKFRRADLHSILKMGQTQRVCKGEGLNAAIGSSASNRLVINRARFALGAVPLQWIEDVKELSMRTPIS